YLFARAMLVSCLSISGGSGCCLARLAPLGGGFLRDQPARADRHLARTKALVPQFEIHALTDAVGPAKLRDAESRRERGISDDFAAGDFGASHRGIRLGAESLRGHMESGEAPY